MLLFMLISGTRAPKNKPLSGSKHFTDRSCAFLFEV